MPVTTKPTTDAESDTLANAIRNISDGYETLKKSGLNKRAVVVLLNDSTGIGKRDIERILDALPQLKKDYCA